MASPRTVIVHPDDLNLADVKALCAQYGTEAVGNQYVPRGSVYVVAAGVLAEIERIFPDEVAP